MEQPKVQYVFSFIEDFRFLSDFYDSREEALAGANKENQPYDYSRVYIGEYVPPIYGIDARTSIESLENEAYQHYDSEDFLVAVTKVESDALQVLLDKALAEWFEKHPNLKPTFYGVKDVVECSLYKKIKTNAKGGL